MELLELFSATDEPLDEVISRHRLKDATGFARVVHVWLRFDNGDYLIQQRNKPNDPMPYQYATTTGMPNVKENPLDCAIREVDEELGLKLSSHMVQLYDKIVTKEGPYKTITYRYFANIHSVPHQSHWDKTEVKDVKRASLKEIRDLIARQAFWNYEALLRAPGYFNALEVTE